MPLPAVFDFVSRHSARLRHRYGGLYTRGAFVHLVAAATELATELRRRATS